MFNLAVKQLPDPSSQQGSKIPLPWEKAAPTEYRTSLLSCISGALSTPSYRECHLLAVLARVLCLQA